MFMTIRFVFYVLLVLCILGCGMKEYKSDAALEPAKPSSPPSAVSQPQSPKDSAQETSAALGEPIAPPIAPIIAPGEAKAFNPQVRSTLTAGYHNDNEQFVRYLDYLQSPIVQGLSVPRINLEERYILQVKDSAGRSLPNCELEIEGYNDSVTLTTASSGEVIFFPEVMIPNPKVSGWEIQGKYGSKSFAYTLVRGTEHVVRIQTNFEREMPSVPIDVVFILDTTGSMGDEIKELKDTIYAIHGKITAQKHIQVKPRFGMVLYRDQGDEYVTKVHEFCNIDEFQMKLQDVEAGGGGDEPEEVHEALHEALTELEWNSNGLRVAFLIADAPPHLERETDYDYIWAMKEAAQRGIKIFPVGASGLDAVGEYVFRQLALFTQGQYIFLTYGETGDSSESSQAKVSHHVGANFKTEKLDTLIIGMIRKELSYVVDPKIIQDIEIQDPTEGNALTLNERVENLTSQLLRQAQKQLQKNPTIAAFPMQEENSRRLNKVTRFVSDAVLQQLQQQGCRLLEREELQKAIGERMAGQDILDEKELAQITKVRGADIFLSGRVYQMGESVVLFAQLVDVNSQEKLAVARVLWTAE